MSEHVSVPGAWVDRAGSVYMLNMRQQHPQNPELWQKRACIDLRVSSRSRHLTSRSLVRLLWFHENIGPQSGWWCVGVCQ